MMSQVNSTFAQAATPSSSVPLPLAGTFYQAAISPAAINTYSKGALILDLGNPTSDSPPVFSLLGVNASNTLVDYPMLNGTKTSLQVADGVLEMHALYGVDESGAGTITNWVAPTGTWALSNLVTQAPGAAGSPGSGAYLLERIKAIRVGLILRTDLPENTKTGAVITAGPLTLFSDLAGLTYTRTLSTAEKGYRYRTVEATIPVRNNLLILQ
jgi:type IV pilus assembly protein PilW